MEELKKLREDISLLKKIGTISEQVEISMQHKLKAIEKQLLLHNVSQQRELLISFGSFMYSKIWHGERPNTKDVVDDFIKRNS